MAFQLKSFADIVRSCLNHIKATQSQITDRNVGSVARTLVEAPAAEMDELYQQLFHGIKEGIATSVYTTFDFQLQPATTSAGQLHFSLASSQTTPVVIPAGTRVQSVAGIGFHSAADATIPAGSTAVTTLGVADSAGSTSTAEVGTITVLVDQVAAASAVSVSNLTRFVGSDVETEPQRKARFNAYISTLARGTLAAISYGASLAVITDTSGAVIERVQSVLPVEPFKTDSTQPIALLNVYIHNGVGSTSSALVTLVSKILSGYYDSTGAPVPGWVAAGVHLVVAAATEVPVAITGTATLVSGYDAPTVRAGIASALSAYLVALPIGSPALLAEIVTLSMGVPGVANVAFSAPTTDVAIGSAQKAMPGTITLS